MALPPKRPGPHQITAFAHAVREGSVSAAARKLGVTQSAVSQHLKKLEDAAVAKLMVLGRDGFQLTKTGEDLFALADQYLTADRLIGEKFADYTQLKQGHLTIIVNAPQPALGLIAAYSEAFPDVQIEFSLCDWTTALRLLQSRTVDIGVVASPRQTAEFEAVELERLRYVLYMRADHWLAEKEMISFANLTLERLILPEEGSLTQHLVTKALKARGIHLPRRIVMTTFPVIKDAILQGPGLGPFLEKSVTSNEGLIERPIAEMPELHPISVVSRRDKSRLHLVQSFLQIADGIATRRRAQDGTQNLTC